MVYMARVLPMEVLKATTVYKIQETEFDYVVPDKFFDLNKFDIKDNEFGRKEVEHLMGNVGFNYPKNTPLINLPNLANFYRIF